VNGHSDYSEHAPPGSPVVLSTECVCGLLVITTARTVKGARRKARRVLFHHLGFARAEAGS
jgi:Tfp pilus assembly protein PilX